jgi:hypothetical protein
LGKKIEIEEDLPFQYLQWRLERIGHVLIACCVVAAFLGLFGRNPLSKIIEKTADGRLSIQYDRFARSESSADFLVTIEPGKHGDGVVRLWLDQHYLDSFQLTAISPLPIRGEARQDGRAFVFQTDGGRFTATLSGQFQTVGTVHGSIKADDGEPLAVTHFVWP